MSKSSRLRTQDFHALYALAAGCRDLGDDPAAWRTHLARRLAALTGATVVSVAESTGGPTLMTGMAEYGWDRGGMDRAAWERLMNEFAARGLGAEVYAAFVAAGERVEGAAVTRADVIRDDDWYPSEYFEYHRATGADAIMQCSRAVADGGLTSMLALVRAAGEPDFGPRDRTLVREAQALLAPLVGGPLAAFADPSPSDLPPRVRRVLRCLLDGDSDKQVASRLALSPYTVNQYVKQIFGHFGVNSRPELLARWVRRGWGARCAWAADAGERVR